MDQRRPAPCFGFSLHFPLSHRSSVFHFNNGWSKSIARSSVHSEVGQYQLFGDLHISQGRSISAIGDLHISQGRSISAIGDLHISQGRSISAVW